MQPALVGARAVLWLSSHHVRRRGYGARPCVALLRSAAASGAPSSKDGRAARTVPGAPTATLRRRLSGQNDPWRKRWQWQGDLRDCSRPFGTKLAAGGSSEMVAVDEEFTTLEDVYTVETEVKKSKFIAHAAPVSSPDEAMAFFEEVRDVEASHNCFAYKIGSEYRFSDDGEPGGTAGQPILRAIEGSGLENVAVMVVRFFGGTKLGAGGLVRAYGGAAVICLKEAPRVTIQPKVLAQIVADYSHVGTLYSLLEGAEGVEKLSEEYTDSGQVSMQLQLLTTVVSDLQVTVRDATNGKVTVDVVDDAA